MFCCLNPSQLLLVIDCALILPAPRCLRTTRKRRSLLPILPGASLQSQFPPSPRLLNRQRPLPKHQSLQPPHQRAASQQRQRRQRRRANNRPRRSPKIRSRCRIIPQRSWRDTWRSRSYSFWSRNMRRSAGMTPHDMSQSWRQNDGLCGNRLLR